MQTSPPQASPTRELLKGLFGPLPLFVISAAMLTYGVFNASLEPWQTAGCVGLGVTLGGSTLGAIFWWQTRRRLAVGLLLSTLLALVLAALLAVGLATMLSAGIRG